MSASGRSCWCGASHSMVGDYRGTARVCGLIHREGQLVEVYVRLKGVPEGGLLTKVKP